jgi:hypothetical protein
MSNTRSKINLTGLLGLIFILGLLTGISLPRLLAVSSESRSTAVPRVLAVYESPGLSDTVSSVGSGVGVVGR